MMPKDLTWLTLTPDQKQAKVRAVMDEGLTTTKAAERLGISRMTLTGVLNKLKAQGWKSASEVSIEETLRLAEQGLPLKEISDRLQVNMITVWSRLRTAGWHNPCRDEAVRLREKVKPLLLQGHTLRDISTRLQVSYHRVRQAKNALFNNEPTPWRMAVNRSREQVKPLLKQGLSAQEISERLGIPYIQSYRAKCALVKREPMGTFPAQCYITHPRATRRLTNPAWKKLTPEQKQAKVRETMVEGMTSAKAAEQLGIPLNVLGAVIQQLKQGGWHRPGVMSPEETSRLREKVKPLLLQGLTVKGISERLQVSYNNVLQAKRGLVARGEFKLKRTGVGRKPREQRKPSASRVFEPSSKV